jgi:hypothetical protein
MNYRLTIEPTIQAMTKTMQALSADEVRELALSTLYRLCAYAVINLIDDAAMLSIVFI